MDKKNIIITTAIILVILLAIVGLVLLLRNIYNPVLVNGVVDAKYPLDIVSNNLASTNNEFTLSFWYYIDGWNYKYNEEKALLNWDDGKLYIAFKPIHNTMEISLKNTDGNINTCVIEDVKLQKWNFVTLTLWNRSLDIILDNNYSHSCGQSTPPDYSNSTDMSLFGNDGFNGKVSNLYFYNYARKISDVIALYNAGPFNGDLMYSLSSKLQGNMTVTVNV